MYRNSLREGLRDGWQRSKASGGRGGWVGKGAGACVRLCKAQEAEQAPSKAVRAAHLGCPLPSTSCRVRASLPRPPQAHLLLGDPGCELEGSMPMPLPFSGETGSAGQPSSSDRSSMLYAPLLSSFSAARLSAGEGAGEWWGPALAAGRRAL